MLAESYSWCTEGFETHDLRLSPVRQFQQQRATM